MLYLWKTSEKTKGASRMLNPNRPKPPLWRIVLYMVLAVLVIYLFGLMRTYG